MAHDARSSSLWPEPYRWQKMLEQGEVGSFDELAARHGVDRSYVGRIVKLAALAPDIVEVILSGDEPNGFSLEHLKRPFPLRWDEQREHFGFPAR